MSIRVLVLGALLVVALLAGGVLLLRPDSGPSRVIAPAVASLAPDAQTPDDLARASCVQLRLAVQGIQAGSAAQDVRAQLAAARVLAAEAVRGDGRWAALSGGAAGLDEAVRRDQAASAATAARVALEQCDAVPAG